MLDRYVNLAYRMGMANRAALTKEEFIELLEQKRGEKPSAHYAQELGISKQYLCDIVNGRTVASANVSEQFGFTPVTMYVAVEPKPKKTRRWR